MPGPTALRLSVPFRPPFHWEGLLEFLGGRAMPGVEEVADGVYRRTCRIGYRAGVMEVRRSRTRPRLEVSAWGLGSEVREAVRRRVAHLFDTDRDTAAVEAWLASDPRLAALVVRSPGLRVAGAWDAFELAVRAVLGQQVTVRGASTLLGRVAAEFGTPLPRRLNGGTLQRVFPGPRRLAAADVAQVGLPRQRGRTVQGLARAVARGRLRLEAEPAGQRAAGPGLAAFLAELGALPGIGAWTASYIAMRARHESDAFPAGDLVLRRVLGTQDAPLAAAELEARAESWRPWRAYAAAHLWRASWLARRAGR